MYLSCYLYLVYHFVLSVRVPVVLFVLVGVCDSVYVCEFVCKRIV